MSTLMDANVSMDNGFAVVQLKAGSESRLLRVLMENGYTNVSFTNAQGEQLDLDEEEDDREKILKIDEGDDDEEIDIECVKENQEVQKQSIQEELKRLIEKEMEQRRDDDAEMKKLKMMIDHSDPSEQTKIEPPSPIEFSSLTLPTVLWSAVNEQAKFPFYNPFLNVPFLPYLPPATTDPASMNQIRPPTDLPFYPSAAELALRPHPLWPSTAGHHGHQQGSPFFDTPPSTPRNSSGAGSDSGSGSCLITGAKLRQRGRQLRRHERDTSAYASCRLCRNRILANRLSNLHNHVRRHAVMKQFHCCYCSYAHTEVAKVRLHMLHNHKDDRTQPLDKRNDDMEAAWSMLMRECFPGYA